jgi:DNA-binding GntR family transcriptional regulator
LGYDEAMPSGATKADLVFDRLRGDILAGRNRPGERLRYTDLCDRYATSMGVLREALLRLVEQGLVVSEAQHGFRVIPVSAADLRELTQARFELEGLTVRLAVTDGDVDWESRLIGAHHSLVRSPQLDPDDPERLSDAWVTAHEKFHAALLDGCDNQRLKAMAATMRAASELYRRWSVTLGGESGRDIPGEHAGILEAAVARDTPRAVDLLTAHIQRTTDILLTSESGMGAAAPNQAAAMTLE